MNANSDGQMAKEAGKLNFLTPYPRVNVRGKP